MALISMSHSVVNGSVPEQDCQVATAGRACSDDALVQGKSTWEIVATMEAAAQQAKDQAELNELVIWAAARGLLADAEELVSRGAEITVRDKHGRRPAHYAAAHGHLGMLQYLSRKGADLEAEDPQARLPLHHAAAAGKGVEALRYLIQHSTWLSAPDAADDTPLHLAARKGWLDGVKLLLAAGVDVDLANKRGLSALGEAVAGGHVGIAEALLRAGADPNWRSAGYTLLHVAAGLGHTRTLELLLRHLGSNSALINDSSNDDGATPLHAAAMAGSAAAVRMLLSNGANAGVGGADGTQAWELVPHADSAPSAGKQQGAGQQQDMQELQRTLKEAARTAGRTQAARSSKVTSRSQVAAGAAAAAAAAAAAQGPEEVYGEQFRQLSPAEQARKVEGFARLPASELKGVPHLSAAAKAAIVQVSHANQLLSVYRAVAALRADEEFQEDAADPEVQAALQDMGRHNNMEKYAGKRHVVSVAIKLKKFHTVMQECGGVKLGLQDLLVPAGQTLADCTAKDATQVEQLTAAAAAARANAIIAITGQPVAADAAASRRVAGKQQGVSVSGGGEIEPTESGTITKSLAEAADTDLDRELLQHKQTQAATVAASTNSVAQRIRRFLKPPREELEAMPFGQRMQYEMVNSFLQAVKIMIMLTAFMAVMWCLGLLPSQQEHAALLQQQAAEQPAAAEDEHMEL